MLQDRTISTQASLYELYHSEVTKAQTILKNVIIPVNVKKRKPFTHHDYILKLQHDYTITPTSPCHILKFTEIVIII